MLDYAFTKEEQTRSELRQVFCGVMNGWSHNSQDQPWFHAWLRCLRSDYKAPGRKGQGGIMAGLHARVMAEVAAKLTSAGRCTIAWDSWENHHRIPMLGCALRNNAHRVMTTFFQQILLHPAFNGDLPIQNGRVPRAGDI